MHHTDRITVRIESTPPPEPGIPLTKADNGEPYVVLTSRDAVLDAGNVVFPVEHKHYIRFPGGYTGTISQSATVLVRPLHKGEKVVIEAVGKVGV
jgi:hypothetical protein